MAAAARCILPTSRNAPVRKVAECDVLSAKQEVNTMPVLVQLIVCLYYYAYSFLAFCLFAVCSCCSACQARGS